MKNIWHFITDDNTSKGKDPNRNIISSIHKTKGKTSVYILVSNYTNKHLTFHKGEYVGHLEPGVMDDTTKEQREIHQANNVTLKKMMAEIVRPDTFNPPTMNYPKLYSMNSIPYCRNMNPNSQRMRSQLELHLSPA